MTRRPFPSRTLPRAGRSVPWVRARLRHGPGYAFGLGLLVLTSVFLAVALPLGLDRYQSDALHRTLTDASLPARSVEALPGQAPAPPGMVVGGPPLGQPALSEIPITATSSDYHAQVLQIMSDVADRIRHTIPAGLPLDDHDISWGVRTTTEDLRFNQHFRGFTLRDDPGAPPLPAPDRVPPHVTLVWQPFGQFTLVAGRLPRDPRLLADPKQQTKPTVVGALEIAVSRSTATLMHWTLGSQTTMVNMGAPQRLTVVGIYRDPTPAEAGRAAWQGETLGAPQLDTVSTKDDSWNFWHFDALISPAVVAVLDHYGDAQAYWWFPADTKALTAGRIPAAQAALASTSDGENAAVLAGYSDLPGGVVLSTALPDTLTAFTRQRDALAPLIAVGAAGTAGTGVAVLLMVFGWASERRAEELALLRARGAGLRFLYVRLLGEAAVCTVPAAALAIALGLVLLPAAEATATGVEAALGVWLLATVAGPVLMLSRHRRVRTRSDLRLHRASRRRTVLELAVLALTVGAVVALHNRGLASADVGLDPLTAVAPLLLALAGAVLLVRIFPLPLRLAARPTARRRGAVGFLGLARAGRTPAAGTLLPLLALLLALTTTVFGETVIGGVSASRDATTLSATGADARITSVGPPLSPALLAALSKVKGVRDASAVRTDPNMTVGSAGLAITTLHLVDPVSYARFSAASGLGPFDPALLSTPGGINRPIPVLATPSVALLVGPDPQRIDTAFGPITVRLVGTLAATPAQPAGDFMLAPAGPVLAQPTVTEGANGPATLLLDGTPDAATLHALVGASGQGKSINVIDRRELRAQLDSAPLPGGASAFYRTAVAATTLLALLAVLLSLLQAAPARSALLARLRTMGLRPRQGYALILAETLPVILLAAVAGSALGAASVPLLGSGVDLGTLSGSLSGRFDDVTHVGPSVQWGPVLVPALVLLVLAAGVVAVEAALIGRRQIGAELRAGDRA